MTRWTLARPRPGEFLRLVRRPVGTMTASTRPSTATEPYRGVRTTF